MLTELARPSEDRERSNARSMDGASSSTDIEGVKNIFLISFKLKLT